VLGQRQGGMRRLGERVDALERRSGSLAKPGAPSRLAIPATATANNSSRRVTTASCPRAERRDAGRNFQEAAPSILLQ
jgi:hypothetical protein